MFSSKEVNYLLIIVRERLSNLGFGIHRLLSLRNIKQPNTTADEDLLKVVKIVKEERKLLMSIRSKLWLTKMRKPGNEDNL